MQADYGLMENLYEQLNDIVDDMIDNIKEAKSVVNKLDGNDSWDGNGYDSYKDKFSNISQNFGAFCNELYKLNNNIKASISNYKEIDRKVMGGF